MATIDTSHMAVVMWNNWIPSDVEAYPSSVDEVEESSISFCSAEQPAISRRLKMSSICDVQA